MGGRGRRLLGGITQLYRQTPPCPLFRTGGPPLREGFAGSWDGAASEWVELPYNFYSLSLGRAFPASQTIEHQRAEVSRDQQDGEGKWASAGSPLRLEQPSSGNWWTSSQEAREGTVQHEDHQLTFSKDMSGTFHATVECTSSSHPSGPEDTVTDLKE